MGHEDMMGVIATEAAEAISMNTSKLQAAATNLYLAGRWDCQSIPTEQASVLWESLRDALGLPVGTATKRGVGSMTTPTETPTENHCKDCCCARSWKALGITEYTGKSIPEHIAQLTAQLARLIEDRARFPDRPDDIGCMIAAHIENLKSAAARHEENWRRVDNENSFLTAQLEEARRALTEIKAVTSHYTEPGLCISTCRIKASTALAAMQPERKEGE